MMFENWEALRLYLITNIVCFREGPGLSTSRLAAVLKLLPFLQWLPELRKTEVWRTDMLAGLTVALVLIPQSMAYAQLAGLPAYYGLYAAFLPPVIAALFGSSRQLATGPVAVVSLMTAAALEPLATSGSPGYISYAILLAMLVGMFQVIMGFARMGIMVNFLSHPVVIGFTNAAAIIIATSQLGKIFGVSAAKAEHHYETVWNIIVAAMEGTHFPTLGMAILAFAIMILLKRYVPRAPGVLLAVVVTTVLSWSIGFEKRAQVTTDDINNKAVVALLQTQQKLQKEVTELEQDIAQAQAHFDLSQVRHGVAAQRTMKAFHKLKSLEEEFNEKYARLGVVMEELTTAHFVFVPPKTGEADDEGKYHLKGDVHPDMNAGSDIWRMITLDDQGVMHLRSGGKVVGAIPQTLPPLNLPDMQWQVILQLLPTAIAISLIGFMEAISIAKVMATRTRQRLDANQELIGQGLSNIVGSLFQSYPVAGSFSRSAVNFNANAFTGFSSVITGLVVAITLLWLTPLLYHLPNATLAAVIMMAVINLVRIKPLMHFMKSFRHDGIAGISTFVLTLALAPHLDKGILIGVAMSLVLFLYRTMKPRVAILGRAPDGGMRDAEFYKLHLCDNISVLRFDGSLYFANISYFQDIVIDRVSKKKDLRFLIVNAQGINQIDASGEEVLRELAEQLRESGIEIYFARLKKQVDDTMRRTGFVEFLGENHFFRRLDQAIEHAWKELGDDHAASCPLNTVNAKAAAEQATGHDASSENMKV